MTFADDENISRRVEGQNLKELVNGDPEYGREGALYAVSSVALAAKSIAVGIKAYGYILAASITAATVLFWMVSARVGLWLLEGLLLKSLGGLESSYFRY